MHNVSSAIIVERSIPLDISLDGCGKKRNCVVSCVVDMDFDGSRYYIINRVMLSSIGLWPYQNGLWSIRIQRFSCLVCFVTCLLSQVLFSYICSYFSRQKIDNLNYY